MNLWIVDVSCLILNVNRSAPLRVLLFAVLIALCSRRVEHVLLAERTRRTVLLHQGKVIERLVIQLHVGP